MKCPLCKHENPPTLKFCGECGARLEWRCPACGAGNPPSNKFCPECGTSRDAGVVPSRVDPPDSYTPRALAERILTERTTLEGERKQITVLFADMKGSMELLADRDPEDARRILDPVLEMMMEAVHHYEGTVNQILGDGIMALFGAPLAHEDHAVRACYAALRMQDAVKRYAADLFHSLGIPVEIRIGLNSGEVVVRAIGSDLRMDYTAVGHTTHLAARMEQLAKAGTILITRDTLRLVEGYVHVRPFAPVHVKGLDAPIPVYEVLEASRVPSRFHASLARGIGRFVGRREELGQLRQALERTLVRGQVVALVGEPGIGKSRLVLEITRSPWAVGHRLLETGAAPYGKTMPFAPIVALLKAYFGVGERDDGPTIQEKVRGRLAAFTPSLAGACPALLALLDVWPDDPGWHGLDPLERRRRTLEAVQAVLADESRIQPLVLVVEDLQWVDAETQALLDALVDTLSAMRVLLLVTHRAEYQSGWTGKPVYTQLSVDPLSPGDAAALLDALVGSDPELDGLKHVLIERADGNPFFLGESVRTVVEAGVLAGERGSHRLARPFAGLRVPTTVEALIAARVDRLSSTDKQLLQSAAAIGQEVPLDLLAAVTGLDEDNVRQGLARLQNAGFLYESHPAPEAQYKFTHAVTQEVAYGALLHKQSRALHGQILEVMERLDAERLGERVEHLAHHAFRAEVWDRAAEYLHAAGRRALLASANTEAVESLEHALVALGRQSPTTATLQKTVAIRLTLRDALWALGRIGPLRHHLHEAEAVAHQLGDERVLGRVACYQCHYSWAVGELDTALMAGERAAAIARSLGDVLLTAETELYRGVVFLAQGQCGRAAQILHQTLLDLDRVAREQPRPGRRSVAIALLLRCFLTRSLAELGRFDEGIAYGEQAVRLADANSTAFGRVTALAGLGALYLRRAEPHAAISLLERALELCRTYSINNWLPTISATLGAAYAATGRVDESVRLLEQAVRLDMEMGMTATLSLWRMYLGEAYLRAGRLADALAETQQALTESRARKERGYEAWLLHLLGRIAATRELSGAEEARTSYRLALELADQLGMQPLVARCALGLARLGERTGDATAASAYRERAIRVAVDLGIPVTLLETP